MNKQELELSLKKLEIDTILELIDFLLEDSEDQENNDPALDKDKNT